MNNRNIVVSPAGLETLQARFGLRVAARLDDAAGDLPHDIAERLKAARELAVGRAREARRVEAAAGANPVVGGGTLALGRGGRGERWLKLAALAPIVALVAGFVLLDRFRTASQIRAAADIDLALLADGVPPAAYSDPGFVEFLKAPRD
jgi:hypothetical protein